MSCCRNTIKAIIELSCGKTNMNNVSSYNCGERRPHVNKD
jgi:hypothetical protein